MNINSATQFKIQEVSIQTKGGQPLNITDLVEEISIYDNLFLPVMSGQILVTDAAKLIDRITLENDIVQIHITKTVDSKFAEFKKAFVIYSISNRKNVTNTSESYILNFVSSELLLSQQQKVSGGFQGKYSKLVDKILVENLKLPESKRGAIEDTQGIVKVTLPNVSPLSALEWCSKRSLSSKNLPEFLFFSNRSGYNFSSLSRLLTRDSILKINFSPKNLDEDDAFFELSKARGFEVVSQADSLTRINSGVDSGSFLGFDPITRTFGAKPIYGEDTFNQGEHGNKNPTGSTIVNADGTTNNRNQNSKQVLKKSTNVGRSNYVKKKDPESISQEEDFSKILLQRQSILSRLMEKRIRIVMPGNFQLSSGFNVDIESSGFGARDKSETPNSDTSLSGKYIIIGTRHIIGSRQHVTVIEVATDSTTDKRKLATNQLQLESDKKYSKTVMTI